MNTIKRIINIIKNHNKISKLVYGEILSIGNEIQRKEFELENEVGHLLSQEDEGTQTSERFYILNQDSEPERSAGMEINDHVVLEKET